MQITYVNICETCLQLSFFNIITFFDPKKLGFIVKKITGYPQGFVEGGIYMNKKGEN